MSPITSLLRLVLIRVVESALEHVRHHLILVKAKLIHAAILVHLPTQAHRRVRQRQREM